MNIGGKHPTRSVRIRIVRTEIHMGVGDRKLFGHLGDQATTEPEQKKGISPERARRKNVRQRQFTSPVVANYSSQFEL
jgi:hypothetical protein